MKACFLVLIFKKILGKIDFVFWDGKFFSIQIAKHRRLANEGEAQLVRIQRLIAIARALILSIDAVLSVSQERVAYVRHMRANLVGSSR